jgi:hypothetical protein
MRAALGTDEWGNLRDHLMEFVTNFQFKVVQATGGFQI